MKAKEGCCIKQKVLKDSYSAQMRHNVGHIYNRVHRHSG